MTISIIILASHPHQTQLCVNSIQQRLSSIAIIVVLPESALAPTTLSDNTSCLLCKTSDNACQRYNLALSRATGHIIWLLTDTMLFDDVCFQELYNHLIANPTIGAVFPTATACQETFNAPIYGMMLTKPALINTGKLNDLLSTPQYAGLDYIFRLRLAGYRPLATMATLTLQAHSPTVPTPSTTLDRKLFQVAWGIDPVDSTAIRQDVMDLIGKFTTTTPTILEIGCATGATLLHLHNLYPQAQLYGIERNPQAAAIAATIAHVTVGDIERFTPQIPAGSCDCIILGDILEKLIDPWQTLTRIQPYLSERGYIVASISNIMHFTIITALLQGRWTYEDTGLLEVTPLRFFTRHQIETLFATAGYRIRQWQSTYLNETTGSRNFIKGLAALAGSEQFIEQYQTYQYLVTATVNPEQSPLSYLLRRIEKRLDPEAAVQILIDYLRHQKLTSPELVAAIYRTNLQPEATIILLLTTCHEQQLTSQRQDLLAQALAYDPLSKNLLALWEESV